MLHLPTDRLAALGDEPPTPEESAHLATCEQCTREHRAYVALVEMAHAEREPFGLPLTRWDAIAAELNGDVVPVMPRINAARAARSNRRMLQVAAGLLLVAGGAVAGRVSAGASALPDARGLASRSAVPDSPARVAQGAQSPVRPVTDSATFASVDEARAAQAQSEMLYQQAAAFLAQYDTVGANTGPVASRARLAALDRVISTTREAMREAPHDPVINGYYLTTLGQREATLQQINTALPASMRVNSF